MTEPAGQHDLNEQEAPLEPGKQEIFNRPQDARWWEGGKQVDPGPEFTPRRLDTPLDRLTRRLRGRRSRTQTDRKSGRYIQARPAGDKTDDIAFDATLRAAAPYQRGRAPERQQRQLAYAIHHDDLQRKIRVRKSANLILFVVDASWSMAVAERMNATKGAIMSLLTDAYQRRDRVGLIVFQKDSAQVVLPPTNSVTLAKKALADIPVGGKTPLSAGLYVAYEVFQRERISHPDVMPLMILLTDGAGNVSMSGKPPLDEAQRIAEQMKQAEIRSVTINMEHAAFDQGLAQRLADQLGGPCYTLAELKASVLADTVRAELES